MALPAGVTTATVTAGVPVSHTGAPVKAFLSIEPSVFLVHTATGTPLVDFLEELDISEGVAGQFTLPHTDQPGFQDENGNAYTNWYYTARLSYSTPSKAKTKAPKIKVFQLPTGQTIVDLDALPGGAPALPYTAPIATVTSVNGRTGPVTLGDGDLPERLSAPAMSAAYGGPIDALEADAKALAAQAQNIEDGIRNRAGSIWIPATSLEPVFGTPAASPFNALVPGRSFTGSADVAAGILLDQELARLGWEAYDAEIVWGAYGGEVTDAVAWRMDHQEIGPGVAIVATAGPTTLATTGGQNKLVVTRLVTGRTISNPTHSHAIRVWRVGNNPSDLFTGAAGLVGIRLIRANARPTVIIFGDSIEQGSVNQGDWFAPANVQAGSPLSLIRNAGVGGNTTQDMLSRIDADVLNYNPDWVISGGGGNDVTRGRTTAQIIADLEAIYAEYVTAGVSFIAKTITPSVHMDTASEHTVIAEVNAWIRSTAVSRGAAAVVDMNAVMREGSAEHDPIDALVSDGVHQNYDGAQVMAGALKIVLDALF